MSLTLDSQVDSFKQDSCFCKSLSQKYSSVIDSEVRDGDRSSFYICVQPALKSSPIDPSNFTVGNDSYSFNRRMSSIVPKIVLKPKACFVHLQGRSLSISLYDFISLRQDKACKEEYRIKHITKVFDRYFISLHSGWESRTGSGHVLRSVSCLVSSFPVLF